MATAIGVAHSAGPLRDDAARSGLFVWRVSTRLVKTAYRSPASGMIEAGCRPACSMNSRTRRYRGRSRREAIRRAPETTYGTSGTAPAVPDKSTPFRLGRVIVYLVGFRPPRHARVGHRSRGYAQPRQDPPLQDDPPAQNAESRSTCAALPFTATLHFDGAASSAANARRSRSSASVATSCSAGLAPTIPSATSGAMAATTLCSLAVS